MVTYLICSELDLLSSVLKNEPPIYYPNRCPKINVTPYLGERIEYQYSNEPRKTIFSQGGQLSYEEKEIIPDNTTVHVFGTFILKRQATVIGQYCNQPYYWRTLTPIYSPVVDQFENDGINVVIEKNDGNFAFLCWLNFNQFNSRTLGYFPSTRRIYYRSQESSCISGGTFTYGDNITFKIEDVVPTESITPLCQFTVKETFPNGTEFIRYQETREEICPEVWQYPCNSGEIQTYNFNLELLEALFITTSSEFALQNGTLNEGFDISEIINFLAGNPDNCLLIWKIERSFGAFFSIQQIAQICSPAGCPPPEYSYECLDCCRNCPPNTCAIECDGHICCYESNSIAVESIPIGEYCNE